MEIVWLPESEQPKVQLLALPPTSFVTVSYETSGSLGFLLCN